MINVSKYLNNLNHPDEAVRREAIVKLSQSGHIKAIPALRNSSLYDESVKNRFYAKKGLSLIQSWISKEAPGISMAFSFEEPQINRELFQKYLCDPVPEKRIQAANAAIKHNDESLVPLLENRMKTEDNPKVLGTLIIAYAMLAKKRGLGTLREYCNHENPDVVCAVLDSLEYIESAEKFDMIAVCAVSKNAKIRSRAFKYLKNSETYNLIPCCRRLFDSGETLEREAAIFVLEQFVASDFRETLVYFRDTSDGEIRKRSNNALLNTITLLEKVAELNPDFDTGDSRSNFETDPGFLTEDDELAEAKIQYDDYDSNEADDYLIELDKMSDTEEPGTENTGAEKETDTQKVKNAVTRSGRINVVKEQIKYQLEIIKDAVSYHKKSKLPFFVEKLTKTDNPVLKASLIIAIGKLGDIRLADTVSGFLHDSEARVRANAVEALKLLNAEDKYHLIVPHLKDENNRVRANAVIALKGQRNVDVYEPLEEMTRGSDLMKKSAIYAIVDLGTRRALCMLKPLLNDIPEICNKTIASLKIFCEQGNSQAWKILSEMENKTEELEHYLREIEGRFNRGPEDYIDDLDSSDTETRRRALMKVKKGGIEAKCIDKIIRLCDDEDPGVSNLAKMILNRR